MTADIDLTDFLLDFCKPVFPFGPVEFEKIDLISSQNKTITFKAKAVQKADDPFIV
jgi:hypothetical protein